MDGRSSPALEQFRQRHFFDGSERVLDMTHRHAHSHSTGGRKSSVDGQERPRSSPSEKRPENSPSPTKKSLRQIKHEQRHYFMPLKEAELSLPPPNRPFSSFSDASDSTGDWEAVAAYKARRNRRRWCEYLERWISIPTTWVHQAGTALRKIQNVHKDFYDWDHASRQKLMFTLSTLLGGLVFLMFFECMHMTFSFYFGCGTAPTQLEGLRRMLEEGAAGPESCLDPVSIWMLSYVMAYVVSIIWQHSLNQCLVFPTPGTGYCESLCLTFSVYFVTLLMSSFFGVFLMTYLHLKNNSQIVMVLTLPVSGVANFYLLRWAFDYSATASKDLDILII